MPVRREGKGGGADSPWYKPASVVAAPPAGAGGRDVIPFPSPGACRDADPNDFPEPPPYDADDWDEPLHGPDLRLVDGTGRDLPGFGDDGGDGYDGDGYDGDGEEEDEHEVHEGYDGHDGGAHAGPAPQAGLGRRILLAFPVALFLILRVLSWPVRAGWAFAGRRGMQGGVSALVLFGALVAGIAWMASSDDVDGGRLAPLWARHSHGFHGVPFPPVEHTVTAKGMSPGDPVSSLLQPAPASPAYVPYVPHPPVYARHTVGEVRASLDVPGNAFLLRPHAGPTPAERLTRRLAKVWPAAEPDLSRLPRPPAVVRPAPPRVPGADMPWVPPGSVRPHCPSGVPCAADYPETVKVGDAAFVPRPDTLVRRAAGALGLPWDAVRFTLPSGKAYEARPWDLTVDATGMVVNGAPTAVALVGLAWAFLIAWALSQGVEWLCFKLCEDSWVGTGQALSFRLLSGLVAMAALCVDPLFSVLGHRAVDLAFLLLVPVPARVRGRLVALGFGAYALSRAASVPLAAPVASLAAGYGALGVGAWDVVGAVVLAALGLALALFGGAGRLPVNVHVSGGRAPLVQDVRVVR